VPDASSIEVIVEDNTLLHLGLLWYIYHTPSVEKASFTPLLRDRPHKASHEPAGSLALIPAG
jgi:hypothetical protein